MPAHGDLVDRFDVGPVAVRVRHSCIRRDMYELVTEQPLSQAVVERLREAGRTKANSPALVIVDVPQVHQLTIAPARGKVVIMPKLAADRPQQREAALQVANVIAGET